MLSRLIKISVAAALVVVVLAEGCVSPKCNSEWLATVEQTQSSAYGGWLQVVHKFDRTKIYGYGELIAVHSDSLFWMEDNHLRSLARTDIRKAQVFTYRSQHGALAAWTVLGTLSTASHGFILIISAPAWILFGSITTGAVSHEPIVGYNAPDRYEPSMSDWLRMSKYARYPQGIPADLDRSLIKAKF